MKFRVIYADPPWPFRDNLTMTSVRRGASSHYKLLNPRDLLRLRVKKLARRDSLLFLWTTGNHLELALELMKAWGFKLSQWAAWVKTTKSGKLHFGMGRIFRYAGELALVGIRGNPKAHIKARNQRNIAVARSLEHSRKTVAFHRRLDQMFDGPKLELFARRSYPGWECVGLELNGEDVRASIRRLSALKRKP